MYYYYYYYAKSFLWRNYMQMINSLIMYKEHMFFPSLTLALQSPLPQQGLLLQPGPSTTAYIW